MLFVKKFRMMPLERNFKNVVGLTHWGNGDNKRCLYVYEASAFASLTNRVRNRSISLTKLAFRNVMKQRILFESVSWARNASLRLTSILSSKSFAIWTLSLFVKQNSFLNTEYRFFHCYFNSNSNIFSSSLLLLSLTPFHETLIKSIIFFSELISSSSSCLSFLFIFFSFCCFIMSSLVTRHFHMIH